jgi:hypothetical protein
MRRRMPEGGEEDEKKEGTKLYARGGFHASFGRAEPAPSTKKRKLRDFVPVRTLKGRPIGG